MPQVPDFAAAITSFGKLLDAITLPKRRKMYPDMECVELWMRNAASVLSLIRGYNLKEVGEESPFVKKIDELLARPEPKKEEQPKKA